MPEDTLYDYLILGQGLAGSLLGWELQKTGFKVMILDNKHANSSSMVAAGLINPLAGWRLNLPDEIAAWMDAANAIYAELEQTSGLKFHHKIPMARLFTAEEQVRFWQRQMDSGRASDYMDARFAIAASDQPVKAPFGGFYQKQTSYVNLPALLDWITNKFLTQQSLYQADIQYTDFIPLDKGYRWQQFSAKNLIFCDGYRCQDNPWFNWLPFTPDKGEFFTIEGGVQPDKIINSGHIAVPLDQGGLRFGATHNHTEQNNQPTEIGRKALLAAMEALFNTTDDMQITAHQAGVRPATQDRQPFLGCHPEQDNMYIFNGFGAKGALTIPWHVKQFTTYLTKGTPLPEAADIRRKRVAAQYS